jgi:hypothetical protein
MMVQHFVSFLVALTFAARNQGMLLSPDELASCLCLCFSNNNTAGFQDDHGSIATFGRI